MDTKALSPGQEVGLVVERGEYQAVDLGVVSAVLPNGDVQLENGRVFRRSGKEYGGRAGWMLVEATDELKAKVRHARALGRITGAGLAKMRALPVDRLEKILALIDGETL